jgi:hypothetical protein
MVISRPVNVDAMISGSDLLLTHFFSRSAPAPASFATLAAIRRVGSRLLYQRMLGPPFDPSLRSGHLLLWTVSIKADEASAHPYFHEVPLCQREELPVVWLAPPCVRVSWIDNYQETLFNGTRNDHLAVSGKPLIANFKFVR